MRVHDHEHDGPEVPRPKSARPHAADIAAAARAAAAGRRDAVTAGSLLALQRAAGNRAVAAALADRNPAAVREVADSGGGQPLQAGVRAGGLAQPLAADAQAPLIQRKAFIGADPKSGKRAKFGVPQSISPGAIDPTIGHEKAGLGEGERNVSSIVTDQKSRYFRNREELYDYASGQTEDIGYVDREKTWVRLPKQFLVLGESHAETTLSDLVEATGTKRYIYEGGAPRPSPYLHRGEPAEGPGRYALEEALPKLVVGLIGVETRLQQELAALSRSPGWKARIRSKAETAEPADLEAEKEEYKRKLAEWSSKWEPGHRGDDTKEGPPRKEYYTRERAEVSTARKTLEELRWVAFGEDERITGFYLENQQVIDETIAQLSRGVPVGLTRMFLKMATGKFDLSGLIRLLSASVEREFSASHARDISKEKGYGGTYAKYGGRYDKAKGKKPAEEEMRADELRMERLRDSYMFHRILEAKEAGYRLAGLGDAHRENLEELLKNDPEILVKRSSRFYQQQYGDHPDRD